MRRKQCDGFKCKESLELESSQSFKIKGIVQDTEVMIKNIFSSGKVWFLSFVVISFFFVVINVVRNQDRGEWSAISLNNEIPRIEFSKSAIINSPFKLLISSHGALSMYDPISNIKSTISTGHGVYYGQIIMPSGDMYIGASPQYTMPKDSESKKLKVPDSLLKFDISSYILDEDEQSPFALRLESFFTHDAITYNDKIYVCNTYKGSLDIYSLPSVGFKLIRSLPYGKKSHINSIAASANSRLFVLLNGLGASSVSVLDKEGVERCIVTHVGVNAHNIIISLTSTAEEIEFYTLSSSEATLQKVSFSYRDCIKSKTIKADVDVLFRYFPDENKFKKPFLKGLLIVNKVAFFSASEYALNRAARSKVKSTLIAYDLVKEEILFERTSEDTGTVGLVNVIGSPTLARESTFQEFEVACEKFLRAGRCLNAQVSASSNVEQTTKLLHLSKLTGIAYGVTRENAYFIKLPLRLDANKLASELALLESNIGWTYRADVNNYFILLVTKDGNPNDQSKIGPFKPIKDRLTSMPYTSKVVASLGTSVGRSRYMKLPAKSEVTLHKDRTSHIYQRKRRDKSTSSRLNELMDGDFNANPVAGYWGRRFRIHIPVLSNPKVEFISEGVSYYMEPGYAYLFDNSLPHEVLNPSLHDRSHLVIDTVGSLRLFEIALDGHIVTKNSHSKAIELPFKEFYKDALVQILDEDVDGPKLFQESILTINSDDSPATSKIYYESWIDNPVFVPMPLEQVTEGWNFIRTTLIKKENYQIFDEIFNEFILIYENDCINRYHDTSVKYISSCANVIDELIWKFDHTEEFGRDYESLEIDDLSAVEAFAKNIFYRCYLDRSDFIVGPACFTKSLNLI